MVLVNAVLCHLTVRPPSSAWGKHIDMQSIQLRYVSHRILRSQAGTQGERSLVCNGSVGMEITSYLARIRSQFSRSILVYFYADAWSVRDFAVTTGYLEGSIDE